MFCAADPKGLKSYRIRGNFYPPVGGPRGNLGSELGPLGAERHGGGSRSPGTGVTDVWTFVRANRTLSPSGPLS